MSKNIIHIYGASGSGTTTLAKYICDNLGYALMDTDDYYWLPTNPPFTSKRSIPERLELMKRDIARYDNVVLSGSFVGWGDELIPLFTLAIRMVTDTNIRLERLKERERKEFGSRIDPDGDMYQNHLEFLEYAEAYDAGDLNVRSKAKHDAWENLLHCPRLTLDGSRPLSSNLELVQKALLDNRPCL